MGGRSNDIIKQITIGTTNGKRPKRLLKERRMNMDKWDLEKCALVLRLEEYKDGEKRRELIKVLNGLLKLNNNNNTKHLMITLVSHEKLWVP